MRRTPCAEPCCSAALACAVTSGAVADTAVWATTYPATWSPQVSGTRHGTVVAVGELPRRHLPRHRRHPGRRRLTVPAAPHPRTRAAAAGYPLVETVIGPVRATIGPGYVTVTARR
ncbi:MAG TPA: hypothetical protein VNQ77_06975 [Frankiaceae bacterium]|nr:hypothetical protein [Frankiaceae bacterium]